MSEAAARDCGPRRPGTIPGRWAVALVVIGPIVVATIISLVAWHYRYDKAQNSPPVGAGAGHTGMANEYGGLGKKAPAAR